MFKVKVSDGIINHCRECVEHTNFGMRKEANGNKEQQLTGIIGQSVVMDLFECGYVDPNGGFDGGVDLEFMGYRIDVKTMGRTTDAKPIYTNNFLKLQDYLNTDIYLFCSYNKNTQELTICGWIDKDEFKTKRTYYPKGTTRTRTDGTTFDLFADTYEIDNSQLNDISSALDFQIQLIKKYKKMYNQLK